MADDVASGIYWYLSSLPDMLAVTGSFPADEPDNSSMPWSFVRNVCARMEDVSIVKGSYSVGAFGNYDPVVQAGSGESGSGVDAGG